MFERTLRDGARVTACHAAACAVSLLLLVEMASARADGRPVPLTVGYFGASEAGLSWVEHETAAFQTQRPDLLVRMTAPLGTAWDDATQSPTPLLPNVFCIDPGRGAQVPVLVDRGVLVPVEGPNVAFLDGFLPETVEAVRHAGKTWGVPWQRTTLLLAYRPASLLEAERTAPPATWEEFFEYLPLLDTPPRNRYRQFGCYLSASDETLGFLFLTMMAQQRAGVMEGSRFHLDPSATMGAIRWLGRIRTSPHVRVTRDDPGTVLLTGFPLAAMYILDTRYLAQVSKEAELALAPLPSVLDDGGAGSAPLATAARYLVVRRGTPEQEAASWGYVRWLTRPDASLPHVWEGHPLRADALTCPDILRHVGQGMGGVAQAFAQAIKAQDPGGHIPGWRAAFDELWRNLEPLLEDPRDADRIIPLAVERANRMLP